MLKIYGGFGIPPPAILSSSICWSSLMSSILVYPSWEGSVGLKKGHVPNRVDVGAGLGDAVLEGGFEGTFWAEVGLRVRGDLEGTKEVPDGGFVESVVEGKFVDGGFVESVVEGKFEGERFGASVGLWVGRFGGVRLSAKAPQVNSQPVEFASKHSEPKTSMVVQFPPVSLPSHAPIRESVAPIKLSNTEKVEVSSTNDINRTFWVPSITVPSTLSELPREVKNMASKLIGSIMSLNLETIVDESSAKAMALKKALMDQREVRVRFVSARTAMLSNQARMKILTGNGTEVNSMSSTSSRIMEDPPVAKATNSTPVFRANVTLLTDTTESSSAWKASQPASGISLSEMMESVKVTSLKSTAVTRSRRFSMLPTVMPVIVAFALTAKTILWDTNKW
jgi:hypothetical protein